MDERDRRRESDSALLSARLDAALGPALGTELSFRNAASFNMLGDAIFSQSASDGAAAFQRGRRNSGTSLSVMFKNIPSRLAGYACGPSRSSPLRFSPRRAERAGSVGWSAGKSGLPGDGDDDIAGVVDAMGAGEGAEAGAPEREFFILPLEDVLVFAALAALQVYVRDSSRSGFYEVDAVIAVLKNEACLPVGRSRVVGSIPAATITRLLCPSSHGRVGFADVLVVLGAWMRLGGELSAPTPPGWVVPPTPITCWPAAIASVRGAVLICRDALPLVIAAIADREMFVGDDADVHDGEHGDGSFFVGYECLRSSKPSANGTASDLALGCPRTVVVEACVAASAPVCPKLIPHPPPPPPHQFSR